MFLGITQIHFSAKLYKTGYIYICPQIACERSFSDGTLFSYWHFHLGGPSDYNNSNTESKISLRVNWAQPIEVSLQHIN